jgi:hypothetical protein
MNLEELLSCYGDCMGRRILKMGVYSKVFVPEILAGRTYLKDLRTCDN